MPTRLCLFSAIVVVVVVVLLALTPPRRERWWSCVHTQDKRREREAEMRAMFTKK